VSEKSSKAERLAGSRTLPRVLRLLTLALEDDICKLTLRLVGDFLVADDNGECGGVNVTFDGVYRKKKR
jgi:hypothetical protein